MPSVLVLASGDVVTDGLSVVAAQLCYHCGVLLECQSPVQDDAKHFHLLRYWQVDPSDVTDRMAGSTCFS